MARNLFPMPDPRTTDQDEDARINDFLTGLLDRTLSGQLRWAVESESQFALRGTAGVVLVSSAKAQGDHPYEFVLIREDGVVAERIRTIPGDFYTVQEDLIESLYKAARSAAYDTAGLVEKLSREWNL